MNHNAGVHSEKGNKFGKGQTFPLSLYQFQKPKYRYYALIPQKD